MRTGAVLAALGLLAACAEEQRVLTAPRVALRRVSGTTFELIPTERQHPNCLVFTLASNGVIRQLTNASTRCPSGRPIGTSVYRAPNDEGAIKVHVLFSSQPLDAASVAQQLLDLRERPQILATDLRLPGSATIETIAFAPEAEAPLPIVADAAP